MEMRISEMPCLFVLSYLMIAKYILQYLKMYIHSYIRM